MKKKTIWDKQQSARFLHVDLAKRQNFLLNINQIGRFGLFSNSCSADHNSVRSQHPSTDKEIVGTNINQRLAFSFFAIYVSESAP